ncbi:hypothetical protein [uncultured Acetobacteroides sp.]|uniref:hypothetical protein n=1 Tax=uncultured Acetobacteroides sp. TaxID=1760811 RepID=UPI0029F56702|nr:hypothetical protein [uncultured Acetobacteroides sp.]
MLFQIVRGAAFPSAPLGERRTWLPVAAKKKSATVVVAALVYGFASLAVIKPILKFDGITNAGEPRAFN